MKNICKKLLKRLTLNQAIIATMTSGIITVILIAIDAKNKKLEIPLMLLWILFIGLTFAFIYISVYKMADYVIERETKACLEILKRCLNNEYKIIKYYPKNIFEMDELYELYEGEYDAKLKLYAKLDDDENICYAIMDDQGNIVPKKKSKKYRFFLENVYLQK